MNQTTAAQQLVFVVKIFLLKRNHERDLAAELYIPFVYLFIGNHGKIDLYRERQIKLIQ